MDTNEFYGTDETKDSYKLEQVVALESTAVYGAFVFNGAAITITSTNNVFGRYSQVESGGSIFLYESTFNDVGSRFFDNYANYGGAIAGSVCTISLEDSEFIGNYASRGAAIYIESTGDLTLEGVKFKKNHAIKEAGGVYMSTKSKLVLQRSQFTGNYAGKAAAIMLIDMSATEEYLIANTKFSDNTADQSLIMTYSATGTIDHCTFDDNLSNKFSQNIFISQSTLTLKNSFFND